MDVPITKGKYTIVEYFPTKWKGYQKKGRKCLCNWHWQ